MGDWVNGWVGGEGWMGGWVNGWGVDGWVIG